MNAASQLGVFDMFTLGIGPSSSHTVGPMRAGRHFAELLERRAVTPSRLRVRLFGSLAATGIGHGTNRAVLLGLGGASPETVRTELLDGIVPQISRTGVIPLSGGREAPFEMQRDLRFEPAVTHDFHVNALTFDIWEDEGEFDDSEITLSHTYYSVGGGFVLVQEEEDGEPTLISQGGEPAEMGECLYPFSSGAELLAQCESLGLSIAQVVRANEEEHRRRDVVDRYLDSIITEMFSCIRAGCEDEGVLPGGLHVPRRAKTVLGELQQSSGDPLVMLDWVTLYALAVNEENAAGHRVVTAPTNGAAGIIPAVMGYLLLSRAAALAGGVDELARKFDLWDLGALLLAYPQLRGSLRDFLLVSAAIGSIIKTNASIAGAEVGCQGEVGSASAMAAAGLVQALGGSPEQVENAAEIAMEHSLGLTCDPVGGLVQIPCIERNAIGAVKAISSARMALYGDGRHQVSLDVAIETMRQTGADMHAKYKETSIGGLAVNVVEC